MYTKTIFEQVWVWVVYGWSHKFIWLLTLAGVSDEILDGALERLCQIMLGLSSWCIFISDSSAWLCHILCNYTKTISIIWSTTSFEMNLTIKQLYSRNSFHDKLRSQWVKWAILKCQIVYWIPVMGWKYNWKWKPFSVNHIPILLESYGVRALLL